MRSLILNLDDGEGIRKQVGELSNANNWCRERGTMKTITAMLPSKAQTYRLVGQLHERLVVDGGDLFLGPVMSGLRNGDGFAQNSLCILSALLLNRLVNCSWGRRWLRRSASVVNDCRHAHEALPSGLLSPFGLFPQSARGS